MKISKIAFPIIIIVLFIQEVFTQNISQQISTGNYSLVWQDNFDGEKIVDENKWTIVVDGFGGGNKELQYYCRKNISIGKEPVSGESCMIIKAQKKRYKSKPAISGRVTTQNKMTFKYGKVEARIKIPKTANGLWPAFWMLGSDNQINEWPKCGEIDIVEMGHKNGIDKNIQDRLFNGACHWGESWNGGSYPNKGMAKTNDYSLQDDFHLYTLMWTEDSIKMFLDIDKIPNNKPYFEMPINGKDEPNNPSRYFHKPFFILFNLAVGGTFSEIFDINDITALKSGPAFMYVDYIRVYQKGIDKDKFISLSK